MTATYLRVVNQSSRNLLRERENESWREREREIKEEKRRRNRTRLGKKEMGPRPIAVTSGTVTSRRKKYVSSSELD